MNFLQPAFLFGLFAVSIPIIIHLFNFRKAKKVYFSNTRFIQAVKKNTSSKRKLRHLLILFSRILFITFLVLAFAQPIIPSRTGGQLVDNVYIYVDNSLSMTNSTEDGNTGLDVALGTVEKILDIYPTNTNYKLLTNDFAPFSNSLKSKDEVRELITEVRRSHVSRSFEEVLNRFDADWLNQEDQNNEIYFISDFQKSTIGDFQEQDTSRRIYLIPIAFPEYQNVYVDTVFLENPFLMSDEANNLNITLRNNGGENVEGLNLKVFVNDVQSSTSSMNLEPNSTNSVKIALSMPLQPVNKVRIDFEEFPVSFDNEFYLVLNKSDRINIVEITGNNASGPVEKVFSNNSLFNFTSQPISNVDYSLINQADLVILNNVDDPENALNEVLKNFYQEGGSLMVIPGENPSQQAYSDLLGVKIIRAFNLEQMPLREPEYENPFYENIFESTDGNIQMPQVSPNIIWEGGAQNLLSLRNGMKYLSRVGERMYLLGSPLDEEYGNFPRHALFVPIMYRIAALSKNVTNRLYFSISEDVYTVELDSLDRKTVYRLIAEEEEYIPGQRIVGNNLYLEIPKYTLTKGFYDIYGEENFLGTIALNIDERESKLSAYSEAELEDQFENLQNVSVFDVGNSKEAEADIKELKFGTPLWKYALILSLLFLLVEVLLIRFFK